MAGNDYGSEKGRLGLGAIARYPKGVFFCLGTEFAERFSYYGMRAVLTLYLITDHNFGPSSAKLWYHMFSALAHFVSIIGSILADGYLGRYRLILYVSILYCFGHVVLTSGAAATAGSTAMTALDFCGLLIIAVSMGGIKPCVSSFAADQFPENMREERKQFFAFFYFSVNVGSLLSKIIMPTLRRYHCLGEDTCFPLAFGTPAIVMLVAAIIFFGGTKFYKVVPRTENVIVDVCRCVGYALRRRANRPRIEKREKHWLDYARPKFDQELIGDIKTIMRLTVLFIPVIVYWACVDQLGSTWVLQATSMNGRVGMLTILPDQMPVLNPFLIIVLVPIMEGIVYPLLSRCNILVKPLRRMGWGGMLAALSFAMAGFVQLQVDKTRVMRPEHGFGRLLLVNYAYGRASIIGQTTNFSVKSGENSWDYNASHAIKISYDSKTDPAFSAIKIKGGCGTCAILFNTSASSPINYDLKKTAGGKTRLYAIVEDDQVLGMGETYRSIVISQDNQVKGDIVNASSFADLEPKLYGSNVYDVFLKSCPNLSNSTACTRKLLIRHTAEMGAANVLVVHSSGSVNIVELIPANTVSMLWQLPQYFVITIGEVLFSITGLEFTYSEASPKMKSVLTAIWLLTNGFGSVVDMIILGSSMMKDNPASEFFTYAAMMTAVMLIFSGLAWRYQSARGTGQKESD